MMVAVTQTRRTVHAAAGHHDARRSAAAAVRNASLAVELKEALEISAVFAGSDSARPVPDSEDLTGQPASLSEGVRVRVRV